MAAEGELNNCIIFIIVVHFGIDNSSFLSFSSLFNPLLFNKQDHDLARLNTNPEQIRRG